MTEKWKLCSDIVGNLTIKSENQSIGRFIRLEEKQCQYVVDLLNSQEQRITQLETELSNMTKRFEYELEMKLQYHAKIYVLNERIQELENELKDYSDANANLEQRIQELLQDNDHKFWKHQFMREFNSTSLIMHEISLAIDDGYEVSDDFREYLDTLKKEHEEGMKKANEQEKW